MDRLASGAAPTSSEAADIFTMACAAARSAGASPADAEDAAQDAVEKLIRRWTNPTIAAVRQRGDNTWKAYVRAAGRNAFKDLVRSRSRRRLRERRADDGASTLGEDARPGSVRPVISGPSDIDRYLARLALLSLIDEGGLSKREREVVVLHLMQGLNGVEIASQLGSSPAVVNRQKRRALAKLRRQVEMTDE